MELITISEENGYFVVNRNTSHLYMNDIKGDAFKVLQNKCNACHSSKKRTDIFTLQNMDSLAFKINEQVFVRRKMPKGRKVKLTENETMALRQWLANTLKKGES